MKQPLFTAFIFLKIYSSFLRSVSYSFGNLHNYSLLFSTVILEEFIAYSLKKSNVHSVLANNRITSTFFFYFTYHIFGNLKMHDKKCNLFQESYSHIYAIHIYPICHCSINLDIPVHRKAHSCSYGMNCSPGITTPCPTDLFNYFQPTNSCFSCNIRLPSPLPPAVQLP